MVSVYYSCLRYKGRDAEISFSDSKMLDFLNLAQYMAVWPKN
jgi:hypothetical protein